MFDLIPDEGGGSWQLVDPRPIKAAAPYTFFTPSGAELAAACAGDLLQLGMAPAGLTDGAAERVWVRLDHAAPDPCDPDPCDPTPWCGVIADGAVPGRAVGDVVSFYPWHVLAVRECRVDTLEDDSRYLARAHVDMRVLEGRVAIALLERREAVPVAGPWGDTGWHVFGTGSDAADLHLHVGPIGLVLNIDDSMIPLLRAPVGSRIERFSEGWRLLRD